MAGSPVLEETGPETSDEPFLGLVDILLLSGLFVAAIWYILRRNKQEPTPTTKSYSIQ